MEYLAYPKLNEIIKRQYPVIKTTNEETTANSLLDFYNNPDFDKISSGLLSTLNQEPAKENKDDIDKYVYFSKNFT